MNQSPPRRLPPGGRPGLTVAALSLSWPPPSLLRALALPALCRGPSSWLPRAACSPQRGIANSARRGERERPGVDLDALPADDPGWSEAHGVVHEEVRRLPARYRSVVVLCCLEGRSNEEAGARRWDLRGLIPPPRPRE